MLFFILNKSANSVIMTMSSQYFNRIKTRKFAAHKKHNSRSHKQATNFNKNILHHWRFLVSFVNIFKETVLLRSSRLQMFFKIGALKNFPIFTRKHLCWSLFLIKRLQQRCFPVNIAKFLRETIFKNICDRPLLEG